MNATSGQQRRFRPQAEQVQRGREASLVLGQHIILDRLGEGGIGQVFKARHRTLNRMVAIKPIDSLAKHLLSENIAIFVPIPAEMEICTAWRSPRGPSLRLRCSNSPTTTAGTSSRRGALTMQAEGFMIARTREMREIGEVFLYDAHPTGQARYAAPADTPCCVASGS